MIKRAKNRIPRVLRDMRFIYTNPGEEWLEEAVGPEKVLRELYRDKPQQFLERLHQLERDHQRSVTAEAKRRASRAAQKRPQEPPPERDEGTARCLKLCEDLLEKLAREHADEDAEFA
jgi:hypothetical protein